MAVGAGTAYSGCCPSTQHPRGQQATHAPPRRKCLVWEPVKNMQISEGWASAAQQPFSPSSPSQSSVGRAEPWASEGREKAEPGESGGGRRGGGMRFGVSRSRTGRCARDSGSSRPRACGESACSRKLGWVEHAVTFWCWASPASLSQDCCLCNESGAALPRFPPTGSVPWRVGRAPHRDAPAHAVLLRLRLHVGG